VEYACIKHFVSLDHSPIKSTLLDMYVPSKISIFFLVLFVLLSCTSSLSLWVHARRTGELKFP
jgi:hypothetical protein